MLAPVGTSDMGDAVAEEAVRVLVVDDDPFAASLIKRVLEYRMTVEVESALDCASARLLLSDHEYDVVTVDYRMPDATGLDLLGEIVEREGELPVIVVTAYGDERLAARAFKLGASGYVKKDHTMPETMPDAVEDSLAKASLNRAVALLNEENAFAETAINALGHVFFALDSEGRFLRWNSSLKEVTGFSDDELFMRPASDFFPEEEAWRLLNAVRSQGRAARAVIELSMPTRKGGPVRQEFTAGALSDSEGRLVGMCAIGRDPVNAVPPRAPRRRGQARAELSQLVGELVLRVDTELRFTFLNDEACGFLGKPREQLLGERLTGFIHPEDIGKTVGLFNKAVDARGPITGFTTRFRSQSGWRHVEWNAAPTLDRFGECCGFQQVGRDVTEQKLNEDFLTRVNLELDAYAHTVSHDLKGPLSAIMLAAGTLQALLKNGVVEDPSETMNEIARIISDHTEQAGVIVDDLLALAEAGQAPVDVEEVDVSQVVDRVVQELESDIKRSDARVEVVGDLGRITANRTQVRQVFSNLLSNAVKHSGCPRPHVRVEYLGEGEAGHRYVVRDNGAGIPPGDLESIFKPFFKGKKGGTGIGLATVHKIVKSYGGDIEARNDNGATFEFTMKDAHGHAPVTGRDKAAGAWDREASEYS